MYVCTVNLTAALIRSSVVTYVRMYWLSVDVWRNERH